MRREVTAYDGGAWILYYSAHTTLAHLKNIREENKAQ